jgi:hypothetical protein
LGAYCFCDIDADRAKKTKRFDPINRVRDGLAKWDEACGHIEPIPRSFVVNKMSDHVGDELARRAESL